MSVVVVVVVISASCAGYGVSSFVPKFFSLNNNFLVNYMIVFRHLNMDFTIILEKTFSQLQDKNISLTVRKKKHSHVKIDAYCFERALG